jgi:hypothetical protein
MMPSISRGERQPECATETAALRTTQDNASRGNGVFESAATPASLSTAAGAR